MAALLPYKGNKRFCMTNLCVDIGNTAVKFGVFRNRELLETVTEPSLMTIENLIAKYEIGNCIMASVKEAAASVKKRIPKNLPCLLFDQKTPVPFNNLYKTPATLGVDRKAGIAGAQSLKPNRPLLVIDAGTCITYDFADDQGNYYGGAISPGLNMRFKALHNFTARLPLVEPGSDTELIGLTTETGIRSGVILGMASEIEGFIARYKKREPTIEILACGGDFHRFQPLIDAKVELIPHLVLIGLNRILEFNATLN